MLNNQKSFAFYAVKYFPAVAVASAFLLAGAAFGVGNSQVASNVQARPLPAGPSVATTLVAGDIAFSGYISQTAPEFSFVLLRNIGSGTVVNFTDAGWINPGAFRNAEETCTWTANSDLSAGQEIRIAGLTATLASGAGTPGIVTGTALGLNTGGDQIIAYQGASASPTIITAIHMNVYALDLFDCANTTAAAWDPDCADGAGGTVGSTPFSKLPPLWLPGQMPFGLGRWALEIVNLAMPALTVVRLTSPPSPLPVRR